MSNKLGKLSPEEYHSFSMSVNQMAHLKAQIADLELKKHERCQAYLALQNNHRSILLGIQQRLGIPEGIQWEMRQNDEGDVEVVMAGEPPK